MGKAVLYGFFPFFMKKRKTLQERINNLFKTKKAKELFEETKNQELRNDIFKTYKNRDSWKDLADRVFSEYVRLYYSDDKWMCECCTCKKRFFRREIQAWHYRSRWCLKYRFDINQVYPQCYTCNVTKHGNYRDYKVFMDETVWKKQEAIYRNDNETVKISQWEYEEMVEKWHIYIKTKKQKIWEGKK